MLLALWTNISLQDVRLIPIRGTNVYHLLLHLHHDALDMDLLPDMFPSAIILPPIKKAWCSVIPTRILYPMKVDTVQTPYTLLIVTPNRRYYVKCVRHGPATRSQPLHPVKVTHPFQLMGMDFIGPFPITKSGARYILNLVCYTTRFAVGYASDTANVADVIRWLRILFNTYRKPQAFYPDQDQHFLDEELKELLQVEGVAVE